MFCIVLFRIFSDANSFVFLSFEDYSSLRLSVVMVVKSVTEGQLDFMFLGLLTGLYRSESILIRDKLSLDCMTVLLVFDLLVL